MEGYLVVTVSSLSLIAGDVSVVSQVSFSLKPGTVTVLMGPNGSGKSSLLNAIAGHPAYTVANGSISYNSQDITLLSPDKRARLGFFLSVQNPHALPGISVNTLLKESFRALNPRALGKEYDKRVAQACQILQCSPQFLERSVHQGFSGGEKKRCEMLQLLVLQPQVVLLDEIDSGLDVDALKSIGTALQWYLQQRPQTTVLLVTHYQNILPYVSTDSVLVMKEGTLVASGDATILTKIAKDGYEQFVTT